MEFPEPVISIAIEPKTKADQRQARPGAGDASRVEDPTFRVHTDEETGQTIISGMGELHLEIIVDRLKREFKVEANVGKPQVAYRETITQVGRRGVQAHQADRRPRPVRPRQAATSSRASAARASSSPTTSSAASSPRSSSRRSRRASREAMRPRRPRRLSRRRRQGRASSTAATTTSTRSAMAFELAGSLAFQDGAKRAARRSCSSRS